MPACCCTSTRGGQRAHPRAGARAVGDVHQVDARGSCSCRACSTSASASVAARRHQLDARRRTRRAPARSPSATSRPRGTGRRRAAAATASRRRAAARPPLAPRRQRAHRLLDVADVLRRRPAAAADEAHAAVDEAPRVRRHVLGRTQIDVPPFDLARPAGVGLRRELDASRRAPSARSSRASPPGPTLQLSPTTCAPQPLELRHERLRRRAVEACCRPLRSSSARRSADRRRSRTARIAAPISFTSRNVSSTNRSTPPSTSAARLLAEVSPPLRRRRSCPTARCGCRAGRSRRRHRPDRAPRAARSAPPAG